MIVSAQSGAEHKRRTYNVLLADVGDFLPRISVRSNSGTGIQELTRALEDEVEKRPVTRRLITHPGVGPLTALAFELVIGSPERFHCGKQIASYVGLVPSEESSGESLLLSISRVI